jgi:DNA processing protein
MSERHLLQLAFGALSPQRVDKLLDRYGPAHRVVSAARRGEPGFGSRGALIVDDAQRRQEQLDRLGVAFVTDPSSPELLRLTRYDASPRWLFRRGDAECLERPTLSIVGSRASTSYGRELAHTYGRVAAERGWTVVSGLARGVDGAAHRGALSVGGGCVGVLGCGIDVAYPPEHADLIERVVEAGSVLSEYPPGTRPDAWRFPTRNRIIAGLSDVVLVVEASERGGALITARIAVDNGIPVYAVPGDIDRVTSNGTNALIRDGAFPVFDGADLATVLSLVVPTLGAHRIPG